jgi:hypothetical protein
MVSSLKQNYKPKGGEDWNKYQNSNNEAEKQELLKIIRLVINKLQKQPKTGVWVEIRVGQSMQ